MDTPVKAAGAEVAAVGAADVRVAELEATLAAREAKIDDLERLLAALTEQISVLAKQVEKLNERLNRNSRNSNKPPSSDPPGSAGPTPSTGGKEKPRRKRGGQPGHRGHRRELLPESHVDEFVDLFPPQCENCWAPLPEVADPEAKRHQHTDLPPI